MNYVYVAIIFYALGVATAIVGAIALNRKNPEAVDKAEATVRDFGK